MSRMTSKTTILAAALCALSSVCVSAVPSHISRAHAPALDRWLLSRPDLRIAADADCHCDRELTWMRSEPSNQSYQPHYAIGDFNGDDHEDFAIVTVDIADASKKLVVVFNGPVSVDTGPAFVGRSDGILVLSRPSSPPLRLLVGRPYSDAAMLVPVGQTYSLVWREP